MGNEVSSANDLWKRSEEEAISIDVSSYPNRYDSDEIEEEEVTSVTSEGTSNEDALMKIFGNVLARVYIYADSDNEKQNASVFPTSVDNSTKRKEVITDLEKENGDSLSWKFKDAAKKCSFDMKTVFGEAEAVWTVVHDDRLLARCTFSWDLQKNSSPSDKARRSPGASWSGMDKESFGPWGNRFSKDKEPRRPSGSVSKENSLRRFSKGNSLRRFSKDNSLRRHSESKAAKDKQSRRPSAAFFGMWNNWSSAEACRDWNKATQELDWKLEVFDVSARSEIFVLFLNTYFLRLGPFYGALGSNGGLVDIVKNARNGRNSLLQRNIIVSYSASEAELVVKAIYAKENEEPVLSWEIDMSKSFDLVFSQSKRWESDLLQSDSLISVLGLSHKTWMFHAIMKEILNGIHVIDSGTLKEDETLVACLERHGYRNELEFTFHGQDKEMEMNARYLCGDQEIISCIFLLGSRELLHIDHQHQSKSIRQSSISIRPERHTHGSKKRLSQKLSVRYNYNSTDKLKAMKWKLLISNFSTVKIQLFKTIEERCYLQSIGVAILIGPNSLRDEIENCIQILELKNRWEEDSEETTLKVQETSLCAMYFDGKDILGLLPFPQKVDMQKLFMKFTVTKGIKPSHFQTDNFEDKTLKLMWKLSVHRVAPNSPLFQSTIDKIISGFGARIPYDEASGRIHTKTPSKHMSKWDRSQLAIRDLSTFENAAWSIRKISINRTKDLLRLMLEEKLCQSVEFFRTSDYGMTLKADVFLKDFHDAEQNLISCLFGLKPHTNTWKESLLHELRLSAITSDSTVIKTLNKYLEDSYVVSEGSAIKLLGEINEDKFFHTVELKRLDEAPNQMSLKIDISSRKQKKISNLEKARSRKGRRTMLLTEFGRFGKSKPKERQTVEAIDEEEIASCIFLVPSASFEKNSTDADLDVCRILNNEDSVNVLTIANLSGYKAAAFQYLDNFLLALDADISFTYLKLLWFQIDQVSGDDSDHWGSYSRLLRLNSEKIKLERALRNDELIERKMEFTRTDDGVKLKIMYCLRKNRHLENIPDIEVASCVFENLSGVTNEKLETHDLLGHLCELWISPKYIFRRKKVLGDSMVLEESVWKFGKTFFERRQTELLRILESREKTEDLIHVLENMVVLSTHPVHLAVGIACSAQKHSYHIETSEHTLVEISKHFSKMALKFINNSPLYEDDKSILDLVRGGLFFGHIISEACNYELTDFIVSGKIQEALSSVLYGVEEIQRLTTASRVEEIFHKKYSLQEMTPRTASHKKYSLKEMTPRTASHKKYSLQEMTPSVHKMPKKKAGLNISFEKIMSPIEEPAPENSKSRPSYDEKVLSRKGRTPSGQMSPAVDWSVRKKFKEVCKEIVALRPRYTSYRKSPFIFSCIELISHTCLLVLTINYLYTKPGWEEILKTGEMQARFGTIMVIVFGGVCYEIGQVIDLKRRYISMWNGVDNASYAFYIAWVWMLSNQYELAYRILSLNGILLMFKVTQFLALSAHFGPLVIMIMNMVHEIIKFMMVFAMLIWGFAVTMYTNFSEEMKDFETVPDSVLTLIEVSMGNFKYSKFEDQGAARGWGVVLLTLYLVFGAVLLLNLLIAILSNTYDKIQSDSDGAWSVMRTTFIVQRFTNAKTSGNRIPNAFLMLPPPLNLLMIPGQLFMWCLYIGNLCCPQNRTDDFIHQSLEEFEERDSHDDDLPSTGEKITVTQKQSEALQEKQSEAFQDSYAEYYQIKMNQFEKEYADLVGKSSVEQGDTLWAILSSVANERDENGYWRMIGENKHLLTLYCIFWIIPLSFLDLFMYFFFQLLPYMLRQAVLWCYAVSAGFLTGAPVVRNAIARFFATQDRNLKWLMRAIEYVCALVAAVLALVLYLVCLLVVVTAMFMISPPWIAYLSLKDHFLDDEGNFKDVLNVDDRNFHYILPSITRVNLGAGFLTKEAKLQAERKANESKLQVASQLTELRNNYTEMKNSGVQMQQSLERIMSALENKKM